jgi:peptidoglycan/xylan/chitin deacetylase (PgdA/CDA1 family)
MSVNVSYLTKVAKQLFLETIFRKSQIINLDRPIVSFTFDDVPVSAFTNGAKILEQFDCRGTYYVASGIQSDNTSFLTPEHIKELVDRGHEIGCHTYSHCSLRWTSGKATLENCRLNTNMLAEIIPGYKVKSFSYPFGLVGPAAKRALNNIYGSMRTVDEGTNTGNVDLSHLRAINLYSDSFDRQKIQKILKQAIADKSWVILYTHDVEDSHGPWGTSIDDFSWVVAQCSSGEFDVRCMDDALAKIQKH